MQPVVEPLDPAIEQKISARFKQALALLNSADKVKASQLALDAWNQMPEPRFGWDVSLSKTRVLVHILREAGQYEPAIDVLKQHLQSRFYQEYQYHPYFLLGTVYFAMGDMDSARENFRIADRISRGRCFVDENPAFKKLLKA
jgi:tetratricopeptide (TPR) repeat protein